MAASAYGDAVTIGRRSQVTFQDLGLPDQAALDALILGLNQRASDYIEKLTNRDFLLHAGDVVLLDGTDTETLGLPGYPVVALTSIKDDGDLIAADEYRLRRGDPLTNSNPGLVDRKPPNDWGKDWNRYEVTYTWGYAAPPPAIVGIVENMVSRLLQAAKVDRLGAGLSAKSMDGFSVTIDRTTLREAMSDGDMAVLNQYRRILAV